MLVVKNQQKAADGMNSFEKLLVDHVRAQDAAMERKDSTSSPHLTHPLRNIHPQFTNFL